jgi:monoterpene epsilon-lactone hydrolase
MTIKPVQIGLRSRVLLFLLIRCMLKPLIWMFAGASVERILKVQARIAGRLPQRSQGLAVDYRIINGVPGPVVGEFDNPDKLAVLYLHGGGFLVPAAPDAQLSFLAALCRRLDATGFLPDYRLAPLHKYPAALDDCERAYRGLLAAGFNAERIALAGESAGGNLVLGLLQRIRKGGLPMPACAVPISAVTEMARGFAPPSRIYNAGRDPMFPAKPLVGLLQTYVGNADGADPELSPLYADYAGFPPLYFLVGETEMLLDDSVLAARQAQAAGVATRLDIWPVLPHAFPLFTALFHEARQSHDDIAGFIREHTGVMPAGVVGAPHRRDLPGADLARPWAAPTPRRSPG